ncbi:ABC transporter permease [Lichenibacterium ramalinae]|uniref:Uncharacterized protein n=1 Tax=Lichenibacterium ramalinae TaxID=2316527 RepID=A0A4Q2RD12_9HYPH|nr:tetratricopeptide repeat protein [Lichenibacterium ramalinae]RYB03052.1 hypothetical protein D3272_18455 [Lichenibacterium ramalinae]
MTQDGLSAPDTLEEALSAGAAAFRSRAFPAAALRFADAAALAPAEAAPWLALARAEAAAGRIAEARRACDEAARLGPAAPRVPLLAARLAARADDGRARIGHLKAAVALHPEAVALRLQLAAALQRRLQHRPALAVVEEALALAPQRPDVRLAAARCHLALNRLDDAAEALAACGPGGPLEAERARLDAELAARRGRATATGPALGDAAAPASATPASPTPASPVAASPVSAAARARVAVSPRAVPSRPADTAGTAPGDVDAMMTAPGDVDAMMTAPGDVDAMVTAPGDVDAMVTAATLRGIARRRRRPRLVDHLMILRALVLRDLRAHHRDNVLGVAVELVRPAVVVFVHYWLFFWLKKPMPGQIPIESYVLAGFATWFAFQSCWAGGSSGGKWPAGATAWPGITDLHLRLAKASWGLTLNLCFCILAFLPSKVVGDGLPLPSVTETCRVFAMAGVSGFGLGLVLEGLGRRFSVMKTVEKLLTWGLFVTSGLYFTLATTPPLVARWYWYNPLLHLIEHERHAFDAGYPVALVDLRYPAAVTVALLVTGLLVYRSAGCPERD